MKALVTGGAGFIASHLIDRLLLDGIEVIALDNLSTGTTKNLEHIKNGILFYVTNLQNTKMIDNLVAGVDVVFHFAAHANIRTSLIDHKADLENNLIGTINILEAMNKHHVKDLVFASTSALIGEASVRPTPETYGGIQNSLYAASKLACESYAEAFTEFSDINFWSFRFSNVIGERCRRGVIWDFVHKLNRNPKELEILGNGLQDKEYIYVEDCIDGIFSGYNNSDKKVNIFNLAVEDNKTVNQVADIVIREMGLEDGTSVFNDTSWNMKKVKRVYTGGYRGWIGDIPVVHLDISKLKSLGWKPKFTADEAITKTVRWTLQNL